VTDTRTYVLASLRRAADNVYLWSLTPTEAGALVAEFERLLETAAHEERAATVAFLRKQAGRWEQGEAGWSALDHAAATIEKGFHRREEPPA
jgi:hypothetical protein